MAEDGKVTVKLTKHGFKPTYDKIYVETNQQRYEFDFDSTDNEYKLVNAE